MIHQTDSIFDTCTRLIYELYHIPFTIIDSLEALTSFVDVFRLHGLQAYMSPKVLTQFIASADKDSIYYFTDLFIVHIILLFIDNTPVIMGPFCTLLMTRRDARALFSQYKINTLKEEDFLYYINSFPCITETEAIQIVSSTLHLLYPNNPDRPVFPIDCRETVLLSEETAYQDRENYTRLLEKRYSYEQHFIKNIISGNSRAAIMNLRNMQMDVAYLKRIGTTLENERIGAAITRTVVRLAALEAGLSPFIVDRISTENTKATKIAKNVDEIFSAKEKMIRDFCRTIHEHQNNHYSALVQSAIYCLEHEYYRTLSIQILADELDVSKNYLIAAFRKETTMTPNVYLRTIRLKQAAILLSSTKLTVQEIANSVGIPDSNYFIKLFKTAYGNTPLAYRKNYRV